MEQEPSRSLIGSRQGRRARAAAGSFHVCLFAACTMQARTGESRKAETAVATLADTPTPIAAMFA